MKKTLVILAAGIGSRFGVGIKQLEPVDDYGHIIIDYSIHDAIAAGFNKLVFIIRRDIEEDFREVIGDRIEKLCSSLDVEVRYAYQGLGGDVVPGRSKPLGTGHAILSCDGLIDEPFAVINADDYYGKSGYKKAAAFLETGQYGLVSYVLKNTLSDNGGTTRGICRVENGRLVGITETKNIVKTADGAEADGVQVDVDALASMNFWCYPPAFMDYLREGFPRFLEGMADPMKDEYLLPIIADEQLRNGTEFTVLPTEDSWIGVTYREDTPFVVRCFRRLLEEGAYRPDLYSDLL